MFEAGVVTINGPPEATEWDWSLSARPIDDEVIRRLRLKAYELRRDVIEMVHRAGQGHPGGSLSAAEIVTALYFYIMRHNPRDPAWPARDRFIMSKGHACPVWYAALAHCGYFPRETLWTLRRTHSILQGHPVMKTPGVDFTTGSLGHGLSAGLGMALGARYQSEPYRVYVLVSDGEMQEGLTWEAAMAAAHYRVRNLIAILDYNGLQIDGSNHEVNDIEPVVDKWKAFGWRAREIDGHDMREVVMGLQWARKAGGPAIVIAHTVKGRGVSFMEHDVEWHGKAPDADERNRAIDELERARRALQ